jgi:hypothetical protein
MLEDLSQAAFYCPTEGIRFNGCRHALASKSKLPPESSFHRGILLPRCIDRSSEENGGGQFLFAARSDGCRGNVILCGRHTNEGYRG